VRWKKNSLPLAAHTVALVLTILKKELLIAQDVEPIRDALSGENANSMLVRRIMKLSIVGCAMSFHVNYSLINLIQNMDRRVPS
jgi:hypothetical protein